MQHYRLLSSWRLAAPREQVFALLHDSERWPEWWSGLERVVKLEDGERGGVGSLGGYAWRGPLPYRVSFTMRITAVEPPRRLEGRAEGTLQGHGRFTLLEEGPVTHVLFEWDVHTTERWMNLTAPLARPLFRWGHDRLMRRGAAGIARRLGTSLVST